MSKPRQQRQVSRPRSADSGEPYRYLIVGGGSAGCLLAHLLAERQEGRIGVVEAGKSSQSALISVPNYYPRTFGRNIDWQFVTAAQPQLSNRQIAWPRGKVLGGSGAINALIYLEADDGDFSRWNWPATRLTAELAPWLETVQDPHPWTERFLESATATGLSRTDCWTQARGNSCGLYRLLQHNGRRCHTGQLLTSPHLHSPESQKRIDVWEQTHALRINLSAGRAMGVEIKRDSGETVTLGATDEIILCAGAIGTPWLLMNSGIGDERHLAELGIACHLHLPSVGVNLQDHLVYPVVYRAREPKGLQSRHDCSAKERYRQLGSGPLASNIAEAGALRGGEDAAWPPKPPDFQIHFTPTHYLRYPQGAIIDDCLTLGVTDLHPASRGMIRLQRNSSGDTIPHIDPGYLMAPIDETRLLEGLAWAQQIASSGPLSELIEENLLPGKGGCNLRWNAKSIRAFSRSIYHPVGTCRMVNPTSAGPLSASSSMPDGVVDTQFRVMGLSGLRIADASVIPDLPSCNTNSVVLGIAIRAAEALLNSSSQHDQ